MMKKLAPNKNVLAKRMADGIVLLDLRDGNYFALNESAGRIWDGICANDDFAQIQSNLVEEFEIPPEKADADIEALVAQLSEMQFLDS